MLQNIEKQGGWVRAYPFRDQPVRSRGGIRSAAFMNNVSEVCRITGLTRYAANKRYLRFLNGDIDIEQLLSKEYLLGWPIWKNVKINRA